jgi:serine/threonine-protein kinase
MAQAGVEYVGPYRLVSMLMSGQTSVVYEVTRRNDNQRFALKMLLQDFRKDKEHIAYLRREYEVGRTLDHPAIIKVHEFSQAEGSYYVIMELFPWPNMKFFVQRDVSRIYWYLPSVIKQMALGLNHFHEQGWLHRDIKPDNFLLSVEEQGAVKLIDFALAQKKAGGLAKLFGGKSKVQGTRSYMSPEQIRGQAIDQRSDMYSFGCTLHELVHGKAPFFGISANELLLKHLKAPPPSLRALNKNVTEEYAGLVQRMLAKNPKDRPETMARFLEEFGRLRIFKAPPKPPWEEEAKRGEED